MNVHDRIRKSIAEAAASAASQAIVCMYSAATDGDTIRAISDAERIVEEIRALGKVPVPLFDDDDVEGAAEAEYMELWAAALDESAEAAHDVAGAE